MTNERVVLSSGLRHKMLALADDPEAVVRRTYAMLMAADDEFSALPESVRLDVLESIAEFVGIWFRTTAEERSPSSTELDALAAAGRRRAHQGRSLNSLLRAFRTGSREILRECNRLGEEASSFRDELLFVVLPYLLEHSNTMAETIARAFLDEQYQGARWRDAMRYQLCTVIFSAPEDLDGFRRAGEALGIDPNGLRVAIAIDLNLPHVTATSMEAELDRLVLAIGRHLKVEPSELVRVLRHGRLVVWIPCVRGDSLLATDLKMRGTVIAMHQSIAAFRSIGVGLMNHGPSGWAASVSEATKAIEFGEKKAAAARTHFYSEIAVQDSVMGTETTLRYLDSLIQRLAQEPELLPTIETYFANGQRRKVTAAALAIHPNTLTYRLERIEDLAGCKLSEFDSLVNLHLAISLRQRSLQGVHVDFRRQPK